MWDGGGVFRRVTPSASQGQNQITPSTQQLLQQLRQLQQLQQLQQSNRDLRSNNRELKESFDTLHNETSREIEALTAQKQQLQQTIKEAQKTVQQERAKSTALEKEILEYKKFIASSGTTTSGMTDETTRRTMNEVFFKVQGWAVDMVRQTNLGELPECPNGKPPADSDVLDFDAGVRAGFNPFLTDYVLQYRNRSREFRVSICMAIVFSSLAEIYEEGYYFGIADDGSPTQATSVAHMLMSKSTGCWRRNLY